MLISSVCLAAILAVSFNISSAPEVLALIVLGIAILFYGLMARLMVGLSQAELNHNVDIYKMLTSYLIQLAAVGIVFMGPYYYVSFIALPWITIATFSNILSVLAKLGYVEIHTRDE